MKDSVAEENASIEEKILNREREMKIPPPQRNPFKVISGLEEQLKREKLEADKKNGGW